jgi:hypothetical protein
MARTHLTICGKQVWPTLVRSLDHSYTNILQALHLESRKCRLRLQISCRNQLKKPWFVLVVPFLITTQYNMTSTHTIFDDFKPILKFGLTHVIPICRVQHESITSSTFIVCKTNESILHFQVSLKIMSCTFFLKFFSQSV